MSIRIAIGQVNPRLGDLQANLALYEERIGHAAADKTQLLLFPELSLTGYMLRDTVPTVALTLDAPEIKQLMALSRKLSFVAGLVEESADHRFFNSAVYFEDGEIRHVHRKVYLPTYGMFDEQRYFARGDRVRAFDTKFGRMALLICEDLWHPSTIYLAALDGALAVLCPSASPLRGIVDQQSQDDNARYWEMLNRVYAETYSLFMIYGNRCGFEDGVGFWGGSEIVDPFGERLAKARYYDEDFIAVDASFEAVRRKRTMSPLLRDEDLDLTINELMRIRERPGAKIVQRFKGSKVQGRTNAEEITRRKKSICPANFNRSLAMTQIPTNTALLRQILVAFIRNEVRKTGLARVVVGLSGGVDSALSAMLAAEALGRQNVLGVLMPYKSSNPDSQGPCRDGRAKERYRVDVGRDHGADRRLFCRLPRCRRAPARQQDGARAHDDSL